MTIQQIEQADLKQLYALRDALDDYIKAREYEDVGGVERINQMIAAARAQLEAQQSQLKAQQSLIARLDAALLGNQPKSAFSPSQQQNGHDLRDRKSMCALLDISPATLTRWVQKFDFCLSEHSRTEHLFNADDEQVLQTVKELRAQDQSYKAIEEKLKDDCPNHSA